MKGGFREPWPAERVAELRDLIFVEGIENAAELARRLGMTRNAVIGERWRRYWNPAFLRTIRLQQVSKPTRRGLA